MPTSTKKSRRRPAGRKPKNKQGGGMRAAIARLTSNLRPASKSTRARKSSTKRRGRKAVGAGIRTRH